MARTSPPPSDEAQPLCTRPSRIFVEDIELHNQSLDGLTPHSSPPASTTRHSETYEGREADPAYPPADSQHQQQHEMRHQSPEPPKQNDKCIQRLWLWESLSIAIATLALTAIVITLVVRMDRPLPDWPSAITINALIAVFTAILKACLMMPIAEGIGQLKWLWYQKSRPLRQMEEWDLASRGPWGSLLLILVLKSQDLAVIGAILTISAMAVDPFTQQVVQFYSCSMVVEGERATVPYSNNYTAGSHSSSAKGESQVDPQMQLAMYVGLLDPPANTSAALESRCRTGNCTFPSTDNGATFMSLALESQCSDIGGDIAFSIDARNITSVFSPEPYTEMSVNATLSDYGLHLNSVFIRGNDPEVAVHAKQSLNTSLSNVMQSGSRTPNDWASDLLIRVAFITFPTLWKNRAEPQDTHAFECEFYPVVNTYSANITNGVLLEQVLDSQRMNVLQYSTGALLVVGRTIREGKWEECTGNLNPSEENNLPLVYLHDDSGVTPEPHIAGGCDLAYASNNITWWPQDCIYSLPYQAAESLSEAISSLLGNETLSYNLEIERPKGSPWSASLWNNGTPTLDTVQATMDGMTRSVTARLRQGDGFSVNMGPANGTVWGTQTCVRVKWVWLALPAGLLLLTIVFFFLTIVKTRSGQARVWKSSIFAVLFSGLDQQTRQVGGPVASLEEMQAAADRMTVRLEDTKEGLRLVSQD